MTTHYYELLFLSTSQGEDDPAKVANKIKKIVTASGAESLYEQTTDKKKLAYAIKRQRHGFFGLIKFTGSTATLVSIRQELNLATEIQRWQLMKKSAQDITSIVKNEEIGQTKPKGPYLGSMQKPTLFTAPTHRAKESEEKVDTAQLDQKLEKLIEGEDLIK